MSTNQANASRNDITVSLLTFITKDPSGHRHAMIGVIHEEDWRYIDLIDFNMKLFLGNYGPVDQKHLKSSVIDVPGFREGAVASMSRALSAKGMSVYIYRFNGLRNGHVMSSIEMLDQDKDHTDNPNSDKE